MADGINETNQEGRGDSRSDGGQAGFRGGRGNREGGGRDGGNRGTRAWRNGGSANLMGLWPSGTSAVAARCTAADDAREFLASLALGKRGRDQAETPEGAADHRVD